MRNEFVKEEEKEGLLWLWLRVVDNVQLKFHRSSKSLTVFKRKRERKKCENVLEKKQEKVEVRVRWWRLRVKMWKGYFGGCK